MNPNIKYVRVRNDSKEEIFTSIQDFADDITYINKQYYGEIKPYKYYIDIFNTDKEIWHREKV